MTKSKVVLKVALDSIKLALRNPRFYIALFIWAVAIKEKVVPVKQLSIRMGINVNAFILPFFFNDMYSIIMITLGMLLIFCDAPFMVENTYYQIVRSGRGVWFLGKVCSIAIQSFLYTIAMAVIPILYLLPNIEYSNKWGKVLGMLAQVEVEGLSSNVLQPAYPILAHYTPVEAMITIFLLIFLNGVFMGLLITTGNLFCSKSAGPVLGAMLAFLPYLTIRLSNVRVGYYISTFSWLDISMFHSYQGAGLPTLSYAYIVLLLGMTLCAIFSYIKIKRMDFYGDFR